ncbi:MAG: GPR endopeptidase [Firmicutes bacterium]|nr:GPR endopeptidase [Bacillota bacterium]
MNNNKITIRTDLALENCEMLKEEGTLSDGIKCREDKTDIYKITTVEILNKTGSDALGRPEGRYVTIESNYLNFNDATCLSSIAEKTAEIIGSLADFETAESILAVGLGNWNITPDALGPKVIDKLLVTRHIMDTVPEELEGNVRSLSALSPGVMGITGIETFEIIKGVADKVKPDVIIAIDALAARNISRVNTTIQLSDTGVAPGAGVGNKRCELSRKTLGIPVIAIGVPTVVDAATLVNDTMEKILGQMAFHSGKGGAVYKMIEEMNDEDKYGLICEMLGSQEANMFVTPKEVDLVIERLSGIISDAVNIAVHPGFSIEDTRKYK